MFEKFIYALYVETDVNDSIIVIEQLEGQHKIQEFKNNHDYGENAVFINEEDMTELLINALPQDAVDKLFAHQSNASDS